MDPTETLIRLLSTLQQLEDAYDEDPKGEQQELFRTEAIGHLKAMTDWLGPLHGHPPAISDIDLDGDEDREEDDDDAD